MAEQQYPHIRVKGGAFERGVQYGRQARDKVQRSVEAYEQVFRLWADAQWSEVRELALRYVPAIEAYAPSAIDEMRGVAEGAGVSFEDVLSINVRTEVMFSAKARSAEALRSVPRECTAVAVMPQAAANGHTLAAQNWDWLVHSRETVIVLEVDQDEGPRFVTLVEAGLLAKFGMNEAGMGVLTNAMVSEIDRGEPAVPYHVVLRSLHDASGMADALTRLQAARRASSANYLLAHRDGLGLDAEGTPGDFAALYLLQPVDGLLAHTNHYVSDRFPRIDVGLWVMPDSPLRLQSVLAFLRERVGKVGVETLQQALSLHQGHPVGVCSHANENQDPVEQEATVVSAVMDLNQRGMWIADGNPCTAGYRHVDYSGFLRS